MKVLQEGDLVMLISRDRKQYVVSARSGGELQTHRGCVRFADLLGQPLGREVQSHLGYPFLVLEPGIPDLIRRLRRNTQIMYPKDIGYVLLKLNVGPGSRIIEAGTGSGALTLVLGRAVAPSGRVYSYESRIESQNLAKANLEALGVTDAVEFRLRDISAGFDEVDVDALFLDLRRPWEYLGHVAAALKGGGFFGAIVPTANQVSGLVEALEHEKAFGNIEVEETLVRPWKPVPSRLRPADRMVAHTGYLVFARSVSRDVSHVEYWSDRKRRRYEGTRPGFDDEEDGSFA